MSITQHNSLKVSADQAYLYIEFLKNKLSIEEVRQIVENHTPHGKRKPGARPYGLFVTDGLIMYPVSTFRLKWEILYTMPWWRKALRWIAQYI